MRVCVCMCAEDLRPTDVPNRVVAGPITPLPGTPTTDMIDPVPPPETPLGFIGPAFAPPNIDIGHFFLPPNVDLDPLTFPPPHVPQSWITDHNLEGDKKMPMKDGLEKTIIGLRIHFGTVVGIGFT